MKNAPATLLAIAAFLSLAAFAPGASADDFPCGNGGSRPVVELASADDFPCGNGGGRPVVELASADDFPCGNGGGRPAIV